MQPNIIEIMNIYIYQQICVHYACLLNNLQVIKMYVAINIFTQTFTHSLNHSFKGVILKAEG